MIPNLFNVEANVWRGGQPDTEGWLQLQALGIKRIIKLNEASEAQDITPPGIESLYLPISFMRQTLGKPSPELLHQAVAEMRLGNVFVHCEHGEDRTGLIVGAYRVEVDKWTKDASWAEMMARGFHPLLRGLCWSWEEDVPFPPAEVDTPQSVSEAAV